MKPTLVLLGMYYGQANDTVTMTDIDTLIEAAEKFNRMDKVTNWEHSATDYADMVLYYYNVIAQRNELKPVETSCPPVIKMYARKCEITGKGFNAGYVFGDGQQYAATAVAAGKIARQRGYKSYSAAYDDNDVYYTEYEDANEHQYVNINGHLIEL